jgi:hypothetical protein
MKELLYDELFFASAEECNDPYEGFPFIVFEPDREKWKCLLEFAWPKSVLEKYQDGFVDYLCSLGNLNLKEFMAMDFLNVYLDDAEDSRSDFIFAIALLKSCLNSYTFQKKYFVSFSRSSENYLMWSHYADQHRGFCLIFRSQDGTLSQRSDSLKSKLTFDNLTISVPEHFTFKNVEYCENVKTVSAFDSFPADVCKKYSFESEEERLKFLNSMDHYFLEKSIWWEYEQEVRLLLAAPRACYAGRIELSKTHRLLHYDPTQLVGIIFGSRTTENAKNRIMELVSDKRLMLARNSDLKGSPNIFMFFQAKMSNFERQLDIIPLGGNSAGDFIKPETLCFKNFYRQWNLICEKSL